MEPPLCQQEEQYLVAKLASHLWRHLYPFQGCHLGVTIWVWKGFLPPRFQWLCPVSPSHHSEVSEVPGAYKAESLGKVSHCIYCFGVPCQCTKLCQEMFMNPKTVRRTCFQCNHIRVSLLQNQVWAYPPPAHRMVCWSSLNSHQDKVYRKRK